MMNDVEDTIRTWFIRSTDQRADGFTQFSYKQKLYKVKWLVDDLLNKCPQFAEEGDFIRENRRNNESQ